MLPDVLSAVIRGLGFVGLFQAAGGAMFIALFAVYMPQAHASIRKWIRHASLVAILLLSLQYALEAARMGGAVSSALDGDLQSLVFRSSLGLTWILRIFGLAVIFTACTYTSRRASIIGLLGAFLGLVTFTLVGHTASMSTDSGWLSVALSIHVFVVAFWFGALSPLYILTITEPPPRVADVVDRFSRVATWCVPLIFVAGGLMMFTLIDTWSILIEPYGALLIAKIVGFALLMGLASLNKWRYAPALALDTRRRVSFQRSLAMEFALIVAILIATAVLTTFFSPGE